MQKIPAFAALFALSFLATDIASAAPRHSTRMPAFRANGLFQPVTPRVLSHTGLPAKFRTRIPFRAQGLFEPLNAPEPSLRRRIVRPLLISLPLLAASSTVIYEGIWYGPVEAAPRPAPATPAAPAGCVTEDISVPGGTVVSIIRC